MELDDDGTANEMEKKLDLHLVGENAAEIQSDEPPSTKKEKA